MEAAVARPEVEFALMYDASLDGWLHDHGRTHKELPQQLHAIRQRIDSVVAAAKQNHDEVYFYIFSDHGMYHYRALQPVPIIGTYRLRNA